ncbi:MAG: hypothetical protein WBC22_13795 [Sedimentisphaerales bacterium]
MRLGTRKLKCAIGIVLPASVVMMTCVWTIAMIAILVRVVPVIGIAARSRNVVMGHAVITAVTAYVVAQDNRAAIMSAVIIRVVVPSVVEQINIVVEVRHAVIRMRYVVGILMGDLLIIVTHHARMRSPTRQVVAKIMKMHSNAKVVNK